MSRRYPWLEDTPVVVRKRTGLLVKDGEGEAHLRSAGELLDRPRRELVHYPNRADSEEDGDGET